MAVGGGWWSFFAISVPYGEAGPSASVCHPSFLTYVPSPQVTSTNQVANANKVVLHCLRATLERCQGKPVFLLLVYSQPPRTRRQGFHSMYCVPSMAQPTQPGCMQQMDVSAYMTQSTRGSFGSFPHSTQPTLTKPLDLSTLATGNAPTPSYVGPKSSTVKPMNLSTLRKLTTDQVQSAGGTSPRAGRVFQAPDHGYARPTGVDLATMAKTAWEAHGCKPRSMTPTPHSPTAFRTQSAHQRSLTPPARPTPRMTPQTAPQFYELQQSRLQGLAQQQSAPQHSGLHGLAQQQSAPQQSSLQGLAQQQSAPQQSGLQGLA